MNKIKAIHQFTPTVIFGDGVSNAILYTQKILKDLGFISNIYVRHTHIARNFQNEVFYIGQYEQSEDQILLYHHSIGHLYHDKIMDFIDKKILVYHNITPSHFFKDDKSKQEACDLGREQLKNSVSNFIAAYSDSDYNKEELLAYKYHKVKTIPILSNLERNSNIEPNKKIIERYHSTYNILFVGRVISNKCQHQLVDVIFQLKKKGFSNVKLFIVGDISQKDYLSQIRNYIKYLKIEENIVFTNKVNNNDLATYYELADLYLSLSEHEGFGMPLIEAMTYDIPVFAYNAGGISTTVIKESLLSYKASSTVANKIMFLIKNPVLRVDIIKKQRIHLESFSYENTKEQLSNFFESLNIFIPNKSSKIPAKTSKVNYQIEGPFDSSYSLSIVNRNIAQSLNFLNNTNVKLFSTEGTGDFEANIEKLDADIKDMANKELERVDISIRNLYPPRTNAMKGYHKIIGPYGWEESKFPPLYTSWFNTKLTKIFAMSEYVKNLLINNGIYIPITTTGIVVEDILTVESEPFSFELPNNFKLLHISSGFARKGIDILLNSFDILDDKLDLSLIIKTFPNIHNKILEQLKDLDYKVEKTYEKDIFLYTKNKKNILLINKDISISKIKYLYENSDVLIAPSFGEGFGLPMAESMLLDLPVITTAYGGQSDFCTNTTSWLIDFDFDFAKTHMNLSNSIWAVPKISSLTKLIEEVYNLPKEQIKYKTSIAKELILNKYSKKQISINIQNAIENYPKEKKKTNIGIFTTFNVKCGIAKYSKLLISKENQDIKIFAPVTEEKSKIEKDSINVLRTWEYGRFTKDIKALKDNLLNHNITDIIIQYNFGFLSLKLLSELIIFCFNNNIKTYLFLHSTTDVKTANEVISFSTIQKELLIVNRIYVHSLGDLNYLKHFDIYKNTYLFSHGVDDSLLLNNNQISNKTPILASFGFLLPQKGILELIDVLFILHKKGIKAKLLLLTSLYPSDISKHLEIEVKNKILKLNLEEYITFNTSFLDEKEIIERLSKVDKVLFIYKNTQESSSAAVRLGLLSQKEVITTPVNIFDDVKEVVTQTKSSNIDDITESIIYAINKKYDNSKQKKWIKENSWKTISKTFFDSIN